MRGIGTDEAGFARRWLGQHVAADVAGGQAQAAQAADHDVGKVLAHAFALGQRIQRGGVDGGAAALVGHAGVDVRHQCLGAFQQRLAGAEEGIGKVGKQGAARHEGRGKGELDGRVVHGPGAVGEVFAHIVPGGRVGQGLGRCGADQAVGGHAQVGMGRLHREKTPLVAERIGRVQRGDGVGADFQPVGQHRLPRHVQRGEVGQVLGHDHGRAVVVTGLVDDAQLHGGGAGGVGAAGRFRPAGCGCPGRRG